jgi:uncharacterized membrane protein YjjB (DUF3815 family)
MDRDIPVLLVVVAIQPMVPVCLLVRAMLELLEQQPVFLVVAAVLVVPQVRQSLQLAAAQEVLAKSQL